MSEPYRPAAVVIGLDCITGLQTARILASRGVPVVGLARDTGHYCCRTNSAERVIAADTRGPGLLSALRALGAERPAEAVLFPCSDEAVLTVGRGRDQLPDGYCAVMPETDTLELLALKSRFYRHAERAGWAIPRTWFLRSRAEAEALAPELTYPCVLKPSLKTPAWFEAVRVKVVRVESRGELLEQYDRCAPAVDELILQEWIPGGDADMYACYSYLDAGSRPVGVLVARKLRQWLPETGSGTLSVTVDCPPIVEETLRVLRDVRYRGLSFLQFKRHARTGAYHVIEANVGRPGIGMPIAEAAGVELLYTQYCDALDLPRPAARPAPAGEVKWICWRRDLASAYHYWRRGELSLACWWRSVRGRRRCAVFSWRDLRPFAADVLRHLPGRRSRSRRRAGGRAPRPTEGRIS